VEQGAARLNWVEERVAITTLGHLDTNDNIFPYWADHKEILGLIMKLSVKYLSTVAYYFELRDQGQRIFFAV
jgi:hypothetical protein